MKSRSWRSWLFGGLPFLLVFVAVGLLIWGIYRFGWDWTGFNGGYSKITIHGTSQDRELPQAKTLWDWLQLLIVPAILAVGAGFFTWWSTRTERQIAQQRYEQDQKIAQQRYEQDQKIAEQRYRQDQELALDKQREDLLQSYLDRMAELLLERGLRDSQPAAEVRKVARTRTVSTLIQLDGKRARTIFVFLGEAQLTGGADPIISFKNADLRSAKWSGGDLGGFNLNGTNLRGANLSGASLGRADLRGANLREANLGRADLRGANLGRADLSKADLSGAHLGGVYFGGANLSGADLSGADLGRAHLGGADLNGANLIEANLSEAYLYGANLGEAWLVEADLRRADLRRADLHDVRLLEYAHLDGTILRGAKGLTPEQLAHCKSKGALIDEEAAPSTSPSPSVAVTSSQETTSQASPSLGQTLPSAHEQEATPEATSSQDHVASPSSSQEGNAAVPPPQGNATLSPPSQDAAS